MASPIVDAHAHLMPRGLPDLAARTGDERWPTLVIDADSAYVVRGATAVRSAGRTLWDTSARLAALDQAGIDRQVLSPVPVTLTDWAEPKLAVEFARAMNELIAEAVAGSAGRFIGLGAVPLADPEHAATEAGRIGELGLAGVEIATLPGGRELDDPALRPFWIAAQSLDLPVFVHPTDAAGAIRRSGQPYEFGIGMLTDTAMAATALLFGGVLEEFPDLRIAFAHGCGALAWTFPRTRLMASATGFGDPDRADALLRTLWVDTLVFDPEHLRLLARRFTPAHLLLGTDDPLVPGQCSAAPAAIRAAADLGILTEAQADAALGPNVLTFLNCSPTSPKGPA